MSETSSNSEHEYPELESLSNTDSDTDSHFTEDTYIMNRDGDDDDDDYDDVDPYDFDDTDSYYNHICRMDQPFLDSEKYSGQYVIGISAPGFNNDGSIFGCAVSPKMFFKFPYKRILKYLFYYSVIRVECPVIDVIQIYIDPHDVYLSIRKTMWISLIQRHWKKTLAERDNIQRQRGSLYSLLYSSIHGKFPPHLNRTPGIIGMMSCYASNVNKYKN